MKLVRKPGMNRIYITGDVDSVRELLSDFNARHDSAGYWLPLYQEPRLRTALEAEAGYQADRRRELAEWEAATAVIPPGYRTRHGAALGGDVIIDGEVISEPALGSSKLPWTRLASRERRVRDLSGQSPLNGRVSDSDTLYVAATADGRPVYRIASWHQFGDNLRETYYVPADLWEQLMIAEVRLRNITPEAAREWLARYRGCVGTELYEFAASSLATASAHVPAARTEGHTDEEVTAEINRIQPHRAEPERP